MMKWRVLTLFCINMYRITQERYSIFLSMIVKSTPVFPVFSVGRNEHKFVICLRVKVFTCNILIEYSVVHPDWTLKHDYSTKIGTSFFLDFHSVREFRPTFYVGVQIICNSFWFFRFFDLSNTWQISISTFSDAHWIIKFSVQHKNNKKNKPFTVFGYMRTRFMHIIVNNNKSSNNRTVIKKNFDIEKNDNHNDNNQGLFILFILISMVILRNVYQ